MKIIPFLTLSWVIITFLTGRGAFPLSHPGWVSASVIPLILLQLLWARKSRDKNVIPLSYGAVIALVVASLLGIGVLMGVLPLFFHQILVWIVGPYLIWVGFKQLSSR